MGGAAGAQGVRLGCIVPGCRRTTALARLKPGDDEWICQRHWSAITRSWRLAYHRARRRGELERAARFWANLKRKAIERAAGI